MAKDFTTQSGPVLVTSLVMLAEHRETLKGLREAGQPNEAEEQRIQDELLAIADELNRRLACLAELELKEQLAAEFDLMKAQLRAAAKRPYGKLGCADKGH